MKSRTGISAALAAAMTITSGTVASAGNELGAFVAGAAVGAIVNQQINNNKQAQQRAARQQQAAQQQQSYSRQQNRETQAALNAFGFNAGVVDGVMGQRSRTAVANYQAYMGYQATGYLDEYQRATLIDSHRKLNAGGGSAYPQVVANEGTRGLLKAFSDPSYANQYNTDSNESVQAAAPAPATAAALAPLDMTAAAPANSMVKYCDAVERKTRANNGMVLASNVTDADQALGEQFCEAREYTIEQMDALKAAANLDDAQIVQACGTIAGAMSEVTAVVGQSSVEDIAIRGRSVVNELANGDMNTATGYGQLCMGIGYREDDAEMALAAAVVLLSTGQMPYAELVGHHLRWGFGTAEAPVEASAWYNTALNALADGEVPAVLPAKSEERAAVINAAVNSPSGTVQPVQASGSLPALNLGNN